MYNYVIYRIKDIISLKNDKHFYFALLLSIKFMMMSATIITYLSIMTMADVSWGAHVSESSSYMWVGVILLLFIFAGKTIIKIHMKIFNAIDEYFRKFIDWYSIRYWRKNKKDSPLLSNISKYSMKLFGWYYKIPVRKRKLLTIAILVCYGGYFILVQFVDDFALWIDHVFPE